ncbi:MAG: 4-(cytidine 5'-diphospho)-2-C-methyl-D-erythritol kinase [Desulfobacterales bacterium]
MRCDSPAKLNLFLAVNGKRSDGYHDITTLFCRVALFDTITLEFGKKEHRVFCTDSSIPSDNRNLAYRAAFIFNAHLKEKRGEPGTGVDIHIEKNIPAGAGIGGGSSNAAGVLMGLNAFYNELFSTPELMKMAMLIGADVPFFIFKKPAIGTGIGERLIPFEKLDPYTAVLVYPGYSVSTGLVFKNLNLGLTKCKQKLNCFLFTERFQCKKHLCNDLETVTERMFPEITDIKHRLLDLGAEGALMSGSGTTVFGLFSDPDKATDGFLVLSENKNWKVFICDLMR